MSPEKSKANNFKPLSKLFSKEFISKITTEFRVKHNWTVKEVSGADFKPSDVNYKGSIPSCTDFLVY